MLRVLTQSLKIISIAAMALVVVFGSIGFFDYWRDRTQSDDVGRPVTVQITEEDDTGTVSDKLTDAELVRYGFYFETRLRFGTGELLPGTYTLRRGMSVPDIIGAITVEGTGAEGETPEEAPVPIEVTLVEGQRAEEFAQVLEEAGLEGGAQAFMAAVNDPGNREQWDFLEDLPEGRNVEGYIFPDTYMFGSNATADEVLDIMLGNFDARFTPEMRQQVETSGRSIHEMVTVASIVEREARVPEERPQVAAVYLNRLQQGMQLQADPTTQYAVGSPENWWPRQLTDEQLAFDSPYNTYIAEGLPPGPISNPGLASLQAAAEPAQVDFLFFVATQDEAGTHVFTNNYEEHQQNICTYIPDACS